jgi:hypothetical protein
MMGFDDFARSHGLIVRSLIPHRWIATPTEDHPRKRNGRYKFLGDIGWVQNWATMQTPRYVDFQFKGGLPTNVA